MQKLSTYAVHGKDAPEHGNVDLVAWIMLGRVCCLLLVACCRCFMFVAPLLPLFRFVFILRPSFFFLLSLCVTFLSARPSAPAWPISRQSSQVVQPSPWFWLLCVSVSECPRRVKLACELAARGKDEAQQEDEEGGRGETAREGGDATTFTITFLVQAGRLVLPRRQREMHWHVCMNVCMYAGN